MSVSKFAVRIHCSSHLSEECKTRYFVISKALKIKEPQRMKTSSFTKNYLVMVSSLTPSQSGQENERID